MDPKKPEDGEDNWSTADIAAMLSGRDESWAAASPSYGGLSVENSPGFHHADGEYIIDPDYMELLGITDPDELVQRKGYTSR